jgi:hypothetical protein
MNAITPGQGDADELEKMVAAERPDHRARRALRAALTEAGAVPMTVAA